MKKDAKQEGINYSLGFKLTFAFIVIVSIFGFILVNVNSPQGDWDSWAIWNHEARFIYRSLSIYRTDVLRDFSVDTFAHPDYPLLIPLTVSRLWSYASEEIFLVPSIVSFIFPVAIGFVMYGAVLHFSNRWNAIFSVIVLLGCSTFLRQSAIQMADVPVSYYLLCCFSLFALYDFSESKQPRYLILAGTFCAFSAWTKNEGLLYFNTILLARSITILNVHNFYGMLRQDFWFMIGAFPVLLVVFWFKIRYFIPNDLISKSGLAYVVEYVSDPDRYWLIFKGFVVSFVHLWKAYIVLIPLLFVCFYRNKFDNNMFFMFVIIAVGLSLFGFSVIYLITSRSLQWHLDTSFGRLLLQMFPSIMLAIFCKISISSYDIPAFLKDDSVIYKRGPR